MRILNRCWGLALTLTILGLAVPAGAQENLDSGKTGAQIFASDCALCHKSPQALDKSGALFGLSGFLRQHYTASRETADVVAKYLESLPNAPAPAKRAAPKRSAKGDDKTKSDVKKPDEKPSDEKKSDGIMTEEKKPDDQKADEKKPAAKTKNKKSAKPKDAKTESPSDSKTESDSKTNSKPESKSSGGKPATPKTSKPKTDKPKADKPKTDKKPDKQEKSD